MASWALIQGPCGHPSQHVCFLQDSQKLSHCQLAIIRDIYFTKWWQIWDVLLLLWWLANSLLRLTVKEFWKLVTIWWSYFLTDTEGVFTLQSDAKLSHVVSTCCHGVLQITHGPVYVVRLSGQIAIPALHMSFATFDFGHCFVYKAGMSIKTAQLKLTNADDKDLMYVCLHCYFKSCVISEC